MFIRFLCLWKPLPFRLLLTLYLLVSVVACGTNAGEATPPDEARNDQVLRRPLDPSGSYVFNPVTGDSIELVLDRNGMPFETMKPTPAKGRPDEFYQQPTKVAPARWEKLEKDQHRPAGRTIRENGG